MKNFFRFTCLTVVLASLFVLVISCDKSYLPWNKNPWPPRGERGHGHTELIQPPAQEPQAVEDFCADLEETIDSWRQYIEPDTELHERRVRYLKILIEQYDRECSQAE